MPRTWTIRLPDVALPSKRLAPEVAEFKTQGLVLRDDLDHLAMVHAAGAPEAAVFYCARILEALTLKALIHINLREEKESKPGSVGLFPQLQLLENLNLIPRQTLYLADSVRRAANDVRHLRRRLEPIDADVAVAFLEPCLEWFFCAFRPGKYHIKHLTRDREPLGLLVAPELKPVVAAFSWGKFSEDEALAALGQEECREAFTTTPTLAALRADLLLGQKRRNEALAVIEAALAKFPQDLRLGQLLGLYHRRGKNTERAIEILTQIRKQNKDDDETVGILAATHKELWLQKGDRRSLEKAHKLYGQGWYGKKRKKGKKPKNQNTWLGINAATTASWLGREEEAKELAAEVKAALEDRQHKLAKTGDRYLTLNYWDQVTLAEAELLLGDDEAARRTYHDAFARYADQEGNIEVSCKQARVIRPTLGLARRWFRVGVTGHRALDREDRLRQVVREALGEIKRIVAGDQGDDGVGLVVLSSLAEGADRLVAEVVLEQEPAALHAILPLEPADYEKDFSTVASWMQFRNLLDRAQDMTVISSGNARPAAYAAAGQRVVERCDVLIALWDGQPARGPGGTAEIVEYARQVEKPLVWCQISPSCETHKERMDGLEPRRGPSQGDTNQAMYEPKPIETAHVTLPENLRALVERLAENAHDVWAKQRMDDGWTYGPRRDDQAKKHPDLVPYADLPESEKDYDRSMALQTIKAVVALGYRIEF